MSVGQGATSPSGSRADDRCKEVPPLAPRCSASAAAGPELARCQGAGGNERLGAIAGEEEEVLGMTRVVGLMLAAIGAFGLWWAVMEQGRLARKVRLVKRAWRM